MQCKIKLGQHAETTGRNPRSTGIFVSAVAMQLQLKYAPFQRASNFRDAWTELYRIWKGYGWGQSLMRSKLVLDFRYVTSF